MRVKMRATAAVAGCLLMAVCMVGFGLVQQTPAPDAALAKTAVAKPTKAQLKAFKKASANFSVKLFAKAVAKKPKGNTVVAPMSVLNAAALMGNGAAGKTKTEMSKVLAGGASISRLDKNLRWFNNQLVDSKYARLNSANAIWYRDDGRVSIKQSFIEKNKTYLGADAKAADFSDPSTVEDINGWVSKNTNGMIPKVVDRLTDDDMSLLVNTLYFNAKWAVPYEQDLTVSKKFTPATGSAHKVKTMQATEHSYISGDGVKGFVKPYRKGYSFVALLPKKGTSLKKFAKSLTGTKFTKLVTGASSKRVITTVPKLDVEYSDEAMENTLAKMGLKRATSEAKADFSKMGKARTGNLHIGNVIHKTRLKLDEEGTEAAAVTAIIAKASSAVIDPEKPKVVKLNRPFVFAIVDNTTKLPLFMGAINDVK